MATDPNQKPLPNDEFETVDDSLEDVLYARHAEVATFEDLEKQRGTTIPALFNQLYKFVQNPSSVSVETYKRMVDTDDTIGSGVDFLTTCLAARLGRYAHDDAEIAAFVNDALDGIQGGWTNFIKEMNMATWAGFYAGEIVWKNTEKGFVPDKIVSLPPTTVLFETERTGELTPDGILQYQRNYNPFLQSTGFNYNMGLGFLGGSGGKPDPFAKFGDFPFPVRTANSFNYLSIRIPRQKCVHYPFNAQGAAGNPYGRSLLRRIYKYYVIEDAILQMMMIALDRKGTPLNVVFADPNTMIMDPAADRGNGAQDYRNNAKAGMTADVAAREAFKNVHNDSTIILPGKEGEIYKVTTIPQSANTADFLAAADFCKKSKLRGMLIPALIFGAGDGSGSYSLGQEHAKTFDVLCDSINSGAEHILLQQFVKQIIAYNFPRERWEKSGLGGFSKRTLSKEEIQKEMEVYEKAINTGVIDANDLNDLNKMRDTLGFEPRTEIIQKPDPFGLEGGGVDPETGEPLPPAAPGAEPQKDQVPPGSAEQKNQPGKPGGQKDNEKKKASFMSRLRAAIAEFFGGNA